MARRTSKREAIPALEWIAATIGLLLFLGMLGLLLREALISGADDVPVLTARVEAVTPVAGGHVARIVVSNASGQTAAAVQVEGRLGEEIASATLDYVPGHSEAKGGLMFRGDPRSGLDLSVLGYELP